jgi:hypothetical protein
MAGSPYGPWALGDFNGRILTVNMSTLEIQQLQMATWWN